MKWKWAFALSFLFLLTGCTSVLVRLDRVKGEHYPQILKDSVLFSIRAPEATLVTIAGNFNGWNDATTPLTKDKDGVWSVHLQLKHSHWYVYRYYVDGYGITDPENPISALDGAGWVVSFIQL